MSPSSSDTAQTEFAALIGPDWGHGSHALALQFRGGATETATLDHSAENLHHWLDQLQQRCGGQPVAVAIEAKNDVARLSSDVGQEHPANVRRRFQIVTLAAA